MNLDKYKVGPESLTFYDKEGNPIGSVDREEGIRRGLLLEAVQLWVMNPETKEVLMQRRSKNKKNNPNKIDVSVSGHVGDSETPIQAILREANEEIGMDKDVLSGKLNKVMEETINLADYGKGRVGRYIAHIYIMFSKNPLNSYVKQDEEVEELFFMPYEELKERVRNEDEEMLMPNGDSSEILFSIIDEKIKEKQKERVE